MREIQIPQATEFIEQYKCKEHADRQDSKTVLNVNWNEVKLQESLWSNENILFCTTCNITHCKQKWKKERNMIN
jgi:hypothetical protein